MEDHPHENQQQYYFADNMHEIPQTPARNTGPSEQNSTTTGSMPVSPSPFPFATPWIPVSSYYPIPETPQITGNFSTPSDDERSHKSHNSARKSLNRSKSLQLSSKRTWQSIKDKVDEILGLLRDWQWSIGMLLYYIFAMKDMKGNQFEPTARHTQMVSKFLTGETQVGVSKILDLWLKSPYGLPPEEDLEREMLYSTTVHYISIKYARPAITSFAAQTVQEKLVKDAAKTVKSNGGLHTFTTQGDEMTSRYDLGAHVFSDVMKIYQEKMLLAWQFLMAIATPNEEAKLRERRPPEYVSNPSHSKFQPLLSY